MTTLHLVPASFPHDPLLEKLRRLRAELAELAFTLDTRGQASAADTASTIAVRIDQLLENEPPALPPA